MNLNPHAPIGKENTNGPCLLPIAYCPNAEGELLQGLLYFCWGRRRPLWKEGARAYFIVQRDRASNQRIVEAKRIALALAVYASQRTLALPALLRSFAQKRLWSTIWRVGTSSISFGFRIFPSLLFPLLPWTRSTLPCAAEDDNSQK